MTNYLNTTFYIGVTNNLLRRVCEHKSQNKDCFTSKYNINKLVYFETTESIEIAIKRVKTQYLLQKPFKIIICQITRYLVKRHPLRETRSKKQPYHVTKCSLNQNCRLH